MEDDVEFREGDLSTGKILVMCLVAGIGIGILKILEISGEVEEKVHELQWKLAKLMRQ